MDTCIYSYLFELFCGGNLKNIESEIKNIETTIFVNERMKVISVVSFGDSFTWARFITGHSIGSYTSR